MTARARATDQRTSTVALAKVVSAGACWALAAVIAKVAFDRGVPPVRVAEMRVVVALAILLVLLRWRRPDLLRPPRGSLPLLAAFGVCLAAVNGTYYVAIDLIPIGVALSLQYTAPVLLLAIAVLSGNRPSSVVVWVAAGLGIAGAILVSKAYEGVGATNLAGVAAGLAAALFFGLYLTLADAAGGRGVHPTTLLLWGFVFAAITWSVVMPWWSFPWRQLADAPTAVAVVAVGILGTLLPFFLAVQAVPVLSPAVAGIAATVEPPFAAAFAWIFLGQRLGLAQIAGGVLVLAGVALAHRGRSEAAAAVEPVP